MLWSCEPVATEPTAPSLPPQQQLPTSLPAAARVKAMVWSPTDQQLFAYNAQGQVSRLVSQWQSVIGDPTQVTRVTYDFAFDAQQRPVSKKVTGSTNWQFDYADALIERAQELDGRPLALSDYQYQQWDSRIRTIFVKRRVDATSTVANFKWELSYDPQGNLTKWAEYRQNDHPTNGQLYTLLQTVEYSDFDTAINPIGWMVLQPYLPQVRWHLNNPRRELRSTPNELGELIEHHYSYNAQGLPSQRRTTRRGLTTTVDFVY